MYLPYQRAIMPTRFHRPLPGIPDMKHYKLGIRTYASDFGFRDAFPLDWIVGGALKKSDVVFVAETPISKERADDITSRGYDLVFLKRYPWIFKKQAWFELFNDVTFDKYLSYNHFSRDHHIRNEMFDESGISSFHYVHSSNTITAFTTDKRKTDNDGMIYPHILSWSPFTSEYYRRYCDIKKYHEVGCIWSSLIPKYKSRNLISVFGTSWNTSDGVANTQYLEDDFFKFVSDLTREFPNHTIIYKPKNPGDPNIPGVISAGDRADTASLIGMSDVVISAPFTSTTMVALGAGKKAYWFCRDSDFSKSPLKEYPGLLVGGVSELSDHLSSRYATPHYIEPYCDGNAISRARDIILYSRG